MVIFTACRALPKVISRAIVTLHGVKIKQRKDDKHGKPDRVFGRVWRNATELEDGHQNTVIISPPLACPLYLQAKSVETVNHRRFRRLTASNVQPPSGASNPQLQRTMASGVAKKRHPSASPDSEAETRNLALGSSHNRGGKVHQQTAAINTPPMVAIGTLRFRFPPPAATTHSHR